jgi:serine/threonine protein phosphatase PrpC
MPPKTQQKGGKNAATPAKKAKKAQDDAAFDKLLKEMATAAPASAAVAAMPTLEERRQKHTQQREQLERAKARQMDDQLSQQLRNKRLQEIFAQLMQMQKASSPFLTSPKRDVEIEEKAAPATKLVGASCCGSVQGWRTNMEDAHVLRPDFDAETALFCVFDGHGGDVCSATSKTVLPTLLALHKGKAGAGYEYLKDVYMQLDDKVKPKISDGSGCTAVTVLVSKTEVACASVGDSRAVVCRKDGSAVPLSFDHKPENASERPRIEAAGGHIAGNRVDGLAMSRAIGDYSLKADASLAADKQKVIAMPDIHVHKRDAASDDFLIVACDGVYDVFDNDALCALIQELYAKAKEASEDKSEAALLREVVKGVCARCVVEENEAGTGPAAAEGTDNVTFALIKL